MTSESVLTVVLKLFLKVFMFLKMMMHSYRRQVSLPYEQRREVTLIETAKSVFEP